MMVEYNLFGKVIASINQEREKCKSGEGRNYQIKMPDGRINCGLRAFCEDLGCKYEGEIAFFKYTKEDFSRDGDATIFGVLCNKGCSKKKELQELCV